ncbi:nuclear transport factor 2 family protein [Rhodococcus sp. IEGM 1304]|uniref:nuclear transport factor 2 family protein n=1 Tax=Rhodococcus sp. IEGM 1304 TaxID=3082227 RepID=UPI0029548AD1|nr:nuclear transport factor 2 family protein [Rhodococcus sp. IEGM 1304]MDV8128851.1 nuclear transport factor 2 family protein [Rhodococcus sp. IEGM 1304]
MTVEASTRAAIENLNARFAWSLDLNQFDDLREVFTPDARYTSRGPDRVGVDSIIATFSGRTAERTTRHGWTSLALETIDSTTVHGRSCWFSYAYNSAPPVVGAPVYMVADFIDVYQLIGSEWRIAERTIVPVFRDPAFAPA